MVLLFVCALTIATTQTPQQIAQKAFRSTVLLVMEDKNGQPLSLGSGFFVKQEQIATNLHVVEGATRGYAKLVGKEAKFNIECYGCVKFLALNSISDEMDTFFQKTVKY